MTVDVKVIIYSPDAGRPSEPDGSFVRTTHAGPVGGQQSRGGVVGPRRRIGPPLNRVTLQYSQPTGQPREV